MASLLSIQALSQAMGGFSSIFLNAQLLGLPVENISSRVKQSLLIQVILLYLLTYTVVQRHVPSILAVSLYVYIEVRDLVENAAKADEERMERLAQQAAAAAAEF